MKRFIALIALASGIGWLAGCKQVTASTPAAPVLAGACNQADATMYQTLVFAQGSLLNLKATLASPQTSASTVTTLTPYYNDAKTAYNLAEVAWQTYHAACVANPSASPTAAQSAVNNLSTAINAVPKVSQ